MEELLKHIGANIRKIRERLEISQGDLAKKIGKHKPFISKIENGKINVTIESMLAVAGALGVEVWELLKFDLEDKTWLAMEESLQYIGSTGCKISPEEHHFLTHLQIKGSPPRDKETYLLFWLLLRWVTGKDLPNLIKLEVSKVDGDIVGTFKVHMEKA